MPQSWLSQYHKYRALNAAYCQQNQQSCRKRRHHRQTIVRPQGQQSRGISALVILSCSRSFAKCVPELPEIGKNPAGNLNRMNFGVL
jgi:hypothetical protein